MKRIMEAVLISSSDWNAAVRRIPTGPTGIGTSGFRIARNAAAWGTAGESLIEDSPEVLSRAPISEAVRNHIDRRFPSEPAELETSSSRICGLESSPQIAGLSSGPLYAWQRTASPEQKESLNIPPIWCPLELHTRGDGIDFHLRSVDFYRRMGFDAESLQAARKTCAGELASMYAPLGDPEGIQLLSDWIMWAFLFDDHYCDDGPISRDPTAFNHLAANLMNFGLYPEREPLRINDFDAFAASLSDIVARVRARTHEAQAATVALSHFRWALAAACGVSDRSGHYMRTVDEHMIARGPDGADITTVCLIEIAEQSWLDYATREQPAVRAISAAAGLLFNLSTDIPSFARERDQHSLEANIIEVIAVEKGCSRQEALYDACALIEEITELFVSLRCLLGENADPQLHRYLEQLSNVIRGTLEWQRRLPRYGATTDSPQRIHSGERLSETAIHDVSQHRLFPRVEPPSSIRWWWDFL